MPIKKARDKMCEDNELIVVYAGTLINASIVKGLLESAGIMTFLQDEITGTLAPWYVDTGGVVAVKVVIAKRDLDRAKPIVKKFLQESA